MKAIIVLAGLVVLLGGVALALHWNSIFGGDKPPMRSTAKADEHPPLPVIDKSLVNAIEIDDGKEKVRVARSGDQWVMPDAFDHPIVADKVKQIFDAVVDLNRAEFIAASPTRHHMFDVDEGGRGKKLKFEDASGKVIVDLVVGKQDIKPGRPATQAGTFVRRAGSNDVFLHGGRLTHLLSGMRKPWLDQRFVTKDPKEINELVDKATKMVIEYDDVELAAIPTPGMPAVDRTGERKRLVLECRKVPVAKEESPTGPKPADNPADPKKDTERKWFFVEPESAKDVETYLPMVDGVTRQILGGRFDDVKGKDLDNPSYGLDKPVVDVTISFEEGVTMELKVGGLVPPPEGSTPTAGMSTRYGHFSGSPWVITVQEFAFKYFQKKPDELKLPAEAAPTPGVMPGSQPIQLPEEGGEKPPVKKDDDAKKDEQGKDK